MACSIVTTLALTATLLGQQSLRLDAQVEPKTAGYCSEQEASVTEPSNPTAIVILKDAGGDVISETKVRVAKAQFFDYGKLTHSHSHGGNVMGGVFPEKQSTFLFKFPRTVRAAQAASVQVQMLDGSYSQTTALKPSTVKAATTKLSLR
ncbi:MAG: hypothetical protein EOP05_17825 [Proteobacteria bacterium]|nr:MAG: hypothetical protein EOP05_17825 [Pseudomonadota bacterium]